MGFDLQVRFGTGEIEGFISEDVFTVGPLSVPGQSFGEISKQLGQVFMVCVQS
jgi:saccharopepsin